MKRSKSKAASRTNASSSRSKQAQEGKSSQGDSEEFTGDNADFPVVVIGASAGGLEALEELFRNVPSDSGMAYVVLTHQSPKHISLLPELLSKDTSMNVIDAREGVHIEANCIYVALPGGQLEVKRGVFSRIKSDQNQSPKFPIDHLFNSIALDCEERVIAVILSGSGSDGTRGLQSVKANFGLAIAQDPRSAKFKSMPEHAIASQLVDYVLLPAAIPRQLLLYAKQPFQRAHLQPTGNDEETVLQGVLSLIRLKKHSDFSHYKRSMLIRRIERRMNVHQIETLLDYQSYMRENPHEIDLLSRELLIGVTGFFRDVKAWEALRIHIEGLVSSFPERYVLRAWVAGCSTGEEAYSLAITIQECIKSTNRYLSVKIFATDMDAYAIEKARTGVFTESVVESISPKIRSQYFEHEGNAYRICKDIREMVIFATQNVISDPPFNNLDLLLCRNVLIYLDTELQKKLLPMFHYALKPDGILFLGAAESIGTFVDLFRPVEKRLRIYSKIQVGRAHVANLPLVKGLESLSMDSGSQRKSFSNQIEKMLMNCHVPVSIVVTRSGDISYIHGRTDLYLESFNDEPSVNVFQIARKGLKMVIAQGLKECAQSTNIFIRRNIEIRANEDNVYVDVILEKILEPESLRGLFLITLRSAMSVSVKALHTTKSNCEDHDESSRIEALRQEFEDSKYRHQTMVEALDSANEELKFAMEEMQSTNEELQSANEELETSKEEMQSLNEELSMVNSMLEVKVEQLSHANDDMQNLLNSTNIATIFLDQELNIKRFTARAVDLFMLRQVDIGRPLSDINSLLNYEALENDCQSVLESLEKHESEILSKQGLWYLIRIIPYRTAGNIIDGLVLTFVEINTLKELQVKQRQLSKVFMEALDPIVVVSRDGIIQDLNTEAQRIYGFMREELHGKSAEMLVPKMYRDELSNLFNRCCRGEVIRNYQFQRLTKAGDESKVLMSLTVLTDAKGDVDGIAVGTRSIDDFLVDKSSYD